jgi:hypothetical protein
MAMITHALERPSPSSEGRRDKTYAPIAYRAAIKTFSLCVVVALGAGAILAAIITAETTFYLRFLIN